LKASPVTISPMPVSSSGSDTETWSLESAEAIESNCIAPVAP
jgi:hypothetical protein